MSLSGRGMAVVSDMPQPQPGAGGAGRELKKQRLKREDHTRVKHDDCFSDWKVLVGPTDWKEHASGKTPDRFRVSNLPSNYKGAGLYELGVTPPAWLPPQRSHVFLKPQDVVVVYVGYAENIHQRLLRYGQTGAHLEGVRSTRLFAVKYETTNRADGGKAEAQNGESSRSFTLDQERNLSLDRGDGGYMSSTSRPISNVSMDANDEGVPSSSELKKGSAFDQAGNRSPSRGPRLFSEVFSLGCSVAFRWAATNNKADAERAEAALIEFFDYAWKRGGNFRQRSPDILSKIVAGGALGSNDSSYGCFGDRSTRTWFFFQRSRPGIPITARKPGIDEDSPAFSRTDSKVGDLFTLFRSNLGSKNTKNSEFTKFDIPLDRCGAPLANGCPCNALPVAGGKRCHLHRDVKNKQFNQGKPGRVAHTNQSSPARDRTAPIIQIANPNSNPKPDSRFHIPEGAESPILPVPKPTSSSSCFPFLITPANSAPSRSSSEPKRRGSLSFTSWLRTSEIRMAKSREWTELHAMGARIDAGPRRSSTYSSILTTCEESQYESPFTSPSRSRREICGLRLDDGTVCPDPPRPDRKRCEAHKGLRNQAPKSPMAMSPKKVTDVSSNPGFF